LAAAAPIVVAREATPPGSASPGIQVSRALKRSGELARKYGLGACAFA
jgi:hypothetical protein